MTQSFDSFRFMDFATRRVMKGFVERARPRGAVAWTALRKPVERCTVALVSTAGVALTSDIPFDQEGERLDPWHGDTSYRIIPRGTTTSSVGVYHLHIDSRIAEQDLDCVLPLSRLEELAREGAVGGIAPSHYSTMGYVVRSADLDVLVEQTAPAIAARMRVEEVDAAVLVPA